MASTSSISENDEPALKRTKLSLPMMASAKPSRSSCEGATVVNVIAPAAVFFPNSVPCGPRNTSMDSISTKSFINAFCRARYTPSTYKPTEDSKPKFCEDVPMPRIENPEFVTL